MRGEITDSWRLARNKLRTRSARELACPRGRGAPCRGQETSAPMKDMSTESLNAEVYCRGAYSSPLPSPHGTHRGFMEPVCGIK